VTSRAARALVLLAALLAAAPARAQAGGVPKRVPPKRSSQIKDGFGINSDLPRAPYLPWERWWWTRMFDAGVKWIRIGQYENSSDETSWDWVERKRGVLAVPPGLDDHVDSLVDNGVKVQVQLLYGNPMYTSPAGKIPDEISPEPGSFHNDDRSLYSVFWPPRTPEQTAAFIRYVKFMVGHFRGRIKYWALWNEQDIGYWNPSSDPEGFGRLLKAFIPAVHEADPDAKVIYGGQAEPRVEYARRALDACACASGIDVFAYHTYPGYGTNLNPERMDADAYGDDSAAKLRSFVRDYPGIRKDIVFWDDEFNSIGTWAGSDDSVQAKYVPRGLLYNWAAGVKTFVWLLAAGTDGNEYDDFGMLHGLRYKPDDFSPRPVFAALQNVNALFSDTTPDPGIAISASDVSKSTDPFIARGFRSASGKAIVAYWLAAHSPPGDAFRGFAADLTMKNSGIQRPVLIDVVSGAITPLEWKKGTTDTLAAVPVTDSVMAVADANYFDWPVLPEAPSGLTAKAGVGGVHLRWEVHGGDASEVAVERRDADGGKWERIAKLAASRVDFLDATPRASASYRVRAMNANGESAYSNVARAAR